MACFSKLTFGSFGQAPRALILRLPIRYGGSIFVVFSLVANVCLQPVVVLRIQGYDVRAVRPTSRMHASRGLSLASRKPKSASSTSGVVLKSPPGLAGSSSGVHGEVGHPDRALIRARLEGRNSWVRLSIWGSFFIPVRNTFNACFSKLNQLPTFPFICLEGKPALRSLGEGGARMGLKRMP